MQWPLNRFVLLSWQVFFCFFNLAEVNWPIDLIKSEPAYIILSDTLVAYNRNPIYTNSLIIPSTKKGFVCLFFYVERNAELGRGLVRQIHDDNRNPSSFVLFTPPSLVRGLFPHLWKMNTSSLGLCLCPKQKEVGRTKGKRQKMHELFNKLSKSRTSHVSH